jgi:hypothetical protein
MNNDELVKATIKNPFYVDKTQPGIVRGGWLDEMGGFLIGRGSQYVADALNSYAEAKPDD